MMVLMKIDDFIKLRDRYSEMFPKKNEGFLTAGALEFAFGIQGAAEILEEAINKNCRIKIIYGEGEDEIKEIIFL